MFNTFKNEKSIETLIGEQCKISGSVSGCGNLKIDGNIEGDVSWQDDVIVEICSSCTGNISCKNADIFGSINGNIICEGTLSIESTGKIYGDITCANLVIKEGAFLKGKCTMITDKNSQELLE